MENQYSYAAELLKKYETFTKCASWDVNAYRLGYGSGTITLDSGKYRKVVKGDCTTVANATKDLTRRIKEFEKKVIKKVGSEYWEPLNYQVKAALISLAYNYGNITKRAIIEAIKTQDNQKIAKAVIDSTYNDNPGKYQKGLRARRQKEATIIATAPQPEKKKRKLLKLLALPLLLGALVVYSKKLKS
jgi:GH24 family phage-related lysozyme (muramidase)